jgi:Protein of unknown function (DUF3108)
MPVSTLLLHGALLARLVASPPYPFAVGERLEYEARLGIIPIGTASMSVNSMARERGREAFVFAAAGEGRPLGIRVGAELTSYVGTRGFNSLRFHRRVFQGTSVEDAQFQIIPDSSRYREVGVPRDWAAPRDPLDELAFLYYLRTAPLELGATYAIPRYFKTGYNPVQVRVLGRETRALPGGATVPALNLEITSRGMTMTVTLTDDARRLPVELELPLPFGLVTLELVRAT